MKVLAVLIVFSLLMGLGTAQEVIVSQNVKLGDYIRQYALVEYSDNGAVYMVPCEDCLSYISLSDADGINYLFNKSMVKLENGLYGYRSSSLTYGKLYTARFEAVSPTYGSSVMYGEVLIADKSEWVGDVAISSVTPTTASSSVNTYDKCDSLNIMELSECQAEGTRVALQEWNVAGYFKLGVVGDILYFGYLIVLSFWNALLYVGTGIFTVINFVVTTAIAGIDFSFRLLDDSRRDAAIMDFMKFLLMIITAILKPFIPFFVIGELFIMFKTSTIKDPGRMMSEFFKENLNIIKGVLNVVVTSVNIVFGFVGGIIAK